jgi:arylsulfatase A-like enzyme
MTEREAPFFLFANYMDVHTPYQAPGNGMDRFLEHDPGRFKRRMTNLAFQNRFDKLQVEIDNGDDVAEEVGALMDRYDAEIAFVDQQLPALLQHLQKVSDAQGRKLLVVITSDHGEGFGEHNILAHGRELWQETLHVPLITWGSASPQGVVEEDVSLIDLASTFTAAAGLESLGRSQDLHAGLDRVLGHLMAEEGPSRSLSHFAPMHRVAVYGEGRKMIYDVEEEAENFSPFGLFDLRADPLEQSPLAETEVTALTERLQSWADRWWRLYLAGREMEAGAELNSMDAATLAELGYTSE